MNRLPLRHVLNIAGLGLVALSLAACQSERKPAASSSASQAALPVMERVALGANACWFKSGDPAFKAYRLAPELNSSPVVPEFFWCRATARNRAPCSLSRRKAIRPRSMPSVLP